LMLSRAYFRPAAQLPLPLFQSIRQACPQPPLFERHNIPQLLSPPRMRSDGSLGLRCFVIEA
jgi:hypothetical protein